jgi:iron complex transport system ATP-binding protein
VLMLRDGRVTTSGPIERVMSEAALSETFGMPLVLQHEAGRWSARRRLRSRVRAAT